MQTLERVSDACQLTRTMPLAQIAGSETVMLSVGRIEQGGPERTDRRRVGFGGSKQLPLVAVARIVGMRSVLVSTRSAARRSIETTRSAAPDITTARWCAERRIAECLSKRPSIG
jgi:hypothetical protein